MKSSKFCMLPLLLLATTARPAVPPPPSIVEPGTPLFADEFKAKSLDINHWSIAKGDWPVEAGAVKGRELADDHHPAVMRATVPLSDAVIHFRFKLDGCGAVSLSINEEKGHHSRVIITPEGFSLVKDRDKKDPRSLSLPLGRCNMPIESGVWHDLIVEYSGTYMLACMDGKQFAVGSQAKIASPKSSLGFTVRGSSAWFDDVAVHTAVPCANQVERISQLLQLQAARGDVAADPRTAYSDAEALLRDRLMKSDDRFNALLTERIDLDADLHKRWPKAFRSGAAGLEAKKQLLAENEEFKALNAKLAKARRAESAYLLKADPQLAALGEALKKSRPSE